MADHALQASVLDVTSLSLATVYAQAYIEPLDAAAAQEAVGELEELAAMLNDQPGARELLTAATLTRRSRLDAVRHVFSGRVSERLEALLEVLARHGRLGVLEAIARQARRLLRVRQGTLVVTVASATELSDQQRQDIAQALSQAFSSKVLLETRVEPELVAGLSIRVGDRLLDASIRARLKQLHRQLSEGRLISPLKT